MSKTSTSTSKCGSCKRVVKDGDPSGIACDNCSVWYHECSCAGLSQEDVTVMGGVSGCLWICSSCRDNDAFKSEAKSNSLLAIKELKISVTSVQNSLTEIKTKLEPARVINKPKDFETDLVKDKKLPPNAPFQLKIDNLAEANVEQVSPENRSYAILNHEMDAVNEVLTHLEESPQIKDIKRLGKFVRNKERPRAVILTLSSAWDVRKILSKAPKMKNFHKPIFIKRMLSPEENLNENRILQIRRDLLNQGTERSLIKIRDRKLFVDGNEIDLFDYAILKNQAAVSATNQLPEKN